MNQINDCYEHIKVIRGVNNGRVSNEQIEDMIIRYQLDVNEKEKLLELLHNKKIYPIPEEEFPGATDKSKEVNKKELTKEERTEILDKRFNRLCKDFKENPKRLKQYLEEIPILKRSIAEQREKYKRKSDWIIAHAIIRISNYRVREKRKRGWVCGTHMSRVSERFQYWLNRLFSDDELEEIIQCCCEEEELSVEIQKMLLIFLDKAPHTIIHPFSSEYLNIIKDQVE